MSAQQDSSSSAPTTSGTSSVPEATPCQSSPAAPSNGSYPNCAETPSGEVCQLICNADYVATANAVCDDGAWTQPSCERLGSLNVSTKSRTGGPVGDATVYVFGYFDPNSEECEDSPFCATSNDNGLAAIAAIPSGTQHVVLNKDGYEELFMPVHTDVNEDADVTLGFLTEGYTSEHFTILLSWTDATDLDLILQVPGPQTTCITYSTEDALEEAPFADHGGDAKSPRRYGPEVVRITPGDPGTGPYYSGVYRVIAASIYEPLVEVNPEIRVVLPESVAPDPLERVRLYRLPSNPDPDVEAWHALNLNSDGTVSSVNDYGQMEDPTISVLPCIAEAYQNATTQSGVCAKGNGVCASATAAHRAPNR